MKTFVVLLYFYAIDCFPLNSIWLKVVNTYRISAGVRAKLLMFVVPDKMKGCYGRSMPMVLQLTSSLMKQISYCLGAYIFKSLDFLRTES